MRRRRTQLRERRHKAAVPTVALVGYTNAGKTTLFNGLTGGDAVASNALFVTLDPLVRKVQLPDRRELLVSDTVGFIDRLPHSLVAAFRATLEEVAAADLLLHVIDASSPDRDRQMAAVTQRARRGRRRPRAVGRRLQQVRSARRRGARPDRRRSIRARCASRPRPARDATRSSPRWKTRLALDTVHVTFEFDRRRRRSRADRAAVSRRPDPPPRLGGRPACRSRPKCPQRLLDRFPSAVVQPS